MKISLRDEFKSLQPFVSEDLSDLVVITGKNGSGKSQLFDLISKKSSQDPSVVTIDFSFIPPIKKIQAEGIVKNTSKKISHD